MRVLGSQSVQFTTKPVIHIALEEKGYILAEKKKNGDRYLILFPNFVYRENEVSREGSFCLGCTGKALQSRDSSYVGRL